MVICTATGRTALRAAVPVQVAVLRKKLFDAMSPGQLETLSEICAAVHSQNAC